MTQERRIGFVGIIVARRETASRAVNEVLSRFGELILARLGLPCRHRKESVITLVVEATTDELGALTGALGQIPDVTLKSALAKESKTDDAKHTAGLPVCPGGATGASASEGT